MELLNNYTNNELLAIALYALNKDDVDTAFSRLKFLLLRDDVPTATYSAIARCYAQLGLFLQAKQYFEQFIALEPDARVERFQLGLVCLDLGEKAEALSTWNAILEEYPEFPPALYHKALVLAQDGDTEKAQKVLQTIFATSSSDNFYFQKGKELIDTIIKNPGFFDSNVNNNAMGLQGEKFNTKH